MNVAKEVVMHLISTSFFGGPEKQIVEHLSRLDPQCFLGILTSFIEDGAENETLDRAKQIGLQTRAIPMASPFDGKAYITLFRLLQRERVSLLCTHGYKATFMGVIAARMLGKKVIAFSRGYTAENRKVAFYEWLERKALEKTSGIISVSHGQQKKLKSLKVRHPRIWVVHNCITVVDPYIPLPQEVKSAVFCELGVPAGRLLIVSAGRLSPEKGHRFLVEAIAKLASRSDSAHFVFCGDGMCLNDLKRQVEELDVLGRCTFVGFRRDMGRIFAAMDFMVLPSLTEGLPNVVLESFAEEKPVVAANVGGVPEIVQDSVNGLLVPPARPDLLAAAMDRLIASAEERHKMGLAGYFRVKESFSFAEQNGKLEDIYRQVLKLD